MIRFETVDKYLNAISQDAKSKLLQLRELIFDAVPNVVETMSYGVPTYQVNGDAKLKDKIMIAGYKNHVSFYPYPDTLEVFKDKLSEYKVLKGTIQFKLKEELPLDLIKEMLEYKFK